MLFIYKLLCVKLFEDLAELGALTKLLKGEFSMSLSISVTHDHVHIAADALSAEGSFGEAGGHGEEIDDTIVFGDEDGGHLLVGNVDAVDGDVGHFAIGELFDELIDLHGGHAGGRLHDVAETEVFDTLCALGAVGDTDNLTGDTNALFGFVAAKARSPNHAELNTGAP